MKRFLAYALLAACGGSQQTSVPSGDDPLLGWEAECDNTLDLLDKGSVCPRVELATRNDLKSRADEIRTFLETNDLSKADQPSQEKASSECRRVANEVRPKLEAGGC